MAVPNVLILRAPGSNCDQEAAQAFRLAGATVDVAHLNEVCERPQRIHRSQILVLPGGFSFGDDVSAGAIHAIRLRHALADALHEYRDAEKLIIGICNGFQVLLKSGILVPPDEDGAVVTLCQNDNGTFQDRWVDLTVATASCPFLKGIERLSVPIAHGEGKFVARQQWISRGLAQSGQVALRYANANPNGSHDDVAGICDASGRVLGLMPHPERHIFPTQHPQWTRRPHTPEGDGLQLFRNAVEFFTK